MGKKCKNKKANKKNDYNVLHFVHSTDEFNLCIARAQSKLIAQRVFNDGIDRNAGASKHSARFVFVYT